MIGDPHAIAPAAFLRGLAERGALGPLTLEPLERSRLREIAAEIDAIEFQALSMLKELGARVAKLEARTNPKQPAPSDAPQWTPPPAGA